jgi:Flp pilus assembly protein TadD
MKRRPHKHIARRYVQAGQLEEAVKHKLIMIQLAPDNPNNFKTWNDIAVHLAKLERFDESLEAIESAIALKGDDPRLQLTYNWVISMARNKSKPNEEASPSPQK